MQYPVPKTNKQKYKFNLDISRITNQKGKNKQKSGESSPGK